MDTLSQDQLAGIAYEATAILKKGKAQNVVVLEFLPKSLSRLVGAKTTFAHPKPAQDEQQLLTGDEFLSLIVNGLVSSKWKADHVVQMATIFREVPMTEVQSRAVARKIFRFMPEVSLGHLPPLVYQLLLFGSKRGHKHLILEEIVKFFNNVDSVLREREAKAGNGQEEDEIQEGLSPKEARESEGSVILHFNFSIKHDHDLALTLVKLFRSQGVAAFTPFMLSLMFSLAHIHRFEEKVMETLRAGILLAFRDAETVEKAEWLAGVIPPKTVDLDVAFTEVINNSRAGWEYITQSLVQLGVILMDGAARIAVDRATERAARLGRKILLETFKEHENVRRAILEQIFSHVVTKSPTATLFIGLLKDLVEECPHNVLGFLPKVKEVLDYLSLLPLKTAEGLLDAVKSIISLDDSFRDHLSLVLRKAMFSKSAPSFYFFSSFFLD